MYLEITYFPLQHNRSNSAAFEMTVPSSNQQVRTSTEGYSYAQLHVSHVNTTGGRFMLVCVGSTYIGKYNLSVFLITSSTIKTGNKIRWKLLWIRHTVHVEHNSGTQGFSTFISMTTTIHALSRIKSVFRMKSSAMSMVVLIQIFLDLRVTWYQIETDSIVLYNITYFIKL